MDVKNHLSIDEQIELLKNTSDWVNFIIELAALIEEYKDNIELYRLGFPDNWHDLLLE